MTTKYMTVVSYQRDHDGPQYFFCLPAQAKSVILEGVTSMTLSVNTSTGIHVTEYRDLAHGISVRGDISEKTKKHYPPAPPAPDFF